MDQDDKLTAADPPMEITCYGGVKIDFGTQPQDQDQDQDQEEEE